MQTSKPTHTMVRVTFRADTIDAVNEGETLWIGVSRVSSSLGIDAEAQRQRLLRAEWACTCVMQAQLPGDSQERAVFCVDLDSLPMWLATIEASRVSEAARPKLLAYQREAAKVLRDHFFGVRAPAAEHPSARAALPDLCARAVAEGDWSLVQQLGGILAGPARRAEQLDLFGETFDPAPCRQRILGRLRRGPVQGGIESLARLGRIKLVRARAVAKEMVANGLVERSRDAEGRNEFRVAPTAHKIGLGGAS